MARHAKDKRPNVKPVVSIELSEKNKRLRGIFAVIFLVIGLAAITFFVFSLLNKESGWSEIEPQDSESGIEEYFVLNYNLGASGIDATSEYKRIAAIYGEELDKYYKLFHNDSTFPGVKNFAYINAHPGEEIELLPELYSVLETLISRSDRTVYMGALNQQYDALFASADDVWAEELDPYKNEEARELYQRLAGYAASAEDVDLRLLGENKVNLYVSEEYAAFAKECGITDYIDLGWLENAFIVDAVADKLIENGHTLGTFSSYDGFTRNLDKSGSKYSFNIWDKYGDAAYPAATLEYTGPMASINYRAYALSSMDSFDYYTYRDGTSAHRYIDTDGFFRAATDNLFVSSKSTSCVELALRSKSVFISDKLHPIAIEQLRDEGIDSVYCIDNVIYKTDGITLTELYSDDKVSYELAK